MLFLTAQIGNLFLEYLVYFICNLDKITVQALSETAINELVKSQSFKSLGALPTPRPYLHGLKLLVYRPRQ